MTRTTDPDRGRSRLLVPLLMSAALAVSLAACGRGGPGPQGPGGEASADKGVEAVPVEVAHATRRAIAAAYSGTAPLEARADAQVVAKTSGVALAVYVEVGERVSAGQVLVRLDSARAEL